MAATAHTHRAGPLLPCALTLCLALVASAGHAQGEAKMYVATDWTPGNWKFAGWCKGNSAPAWDEMVDGWYFVMDDFGAFVLDGRYRNGHLSRNLLCDIDTGIAGCNDHNRLDDADAAMIGIHGADNGTRWSGTVRYSGDAGDDCSIDAPGGPRDGRGELFVGDSDLEFLHLSSCNSLDDDNLIYAWQLFQDPVDSPQNGRRLHMLTGFHGSMWIGSGRVGDYVSFALAGHAGIRDAWLDHLYDDGIESADYEQCPVAYAVGSSDADCFNRLLNESYLNIVTPDPVINRWCASAFTGCDPKADGPFSWP